MCLEVHLLLLDSLLLFQLGPEPLVLNVALGSKYRVLMGTMLHGAQLVNQLLFVGLASGPH